MANEFAPVIGKIDQVKGLMSGSALRRITTRVASKSKPVAISAISPNTLSHWGRGARKGGHRVQARYVVLSDHEAALRPTVPPLAGLLEHGSGTRWKTPRRRGAARRKRGTVGGSYTRTAVPARHAWSKAVDPVADKAPGFVHEEVQRVLRSVF